MGNKDNKDIFGVLRLVAAFPRADLSAFWLSTDNSRADKSARGKAETSLRTPNMSLSSLITTHTTIIIKLLSLNFYRTSRP